MTLLKFLFALVSLGLLLFYGAVVPFLAAALVFRETSVLPQLLGGLLVFGPCITLLLLPIGLLPIWRGNRLLLLGLTADLLAAPFLIEEIHGSHTSQSSEFLLLHLFYIGVWWPLAIPRSTA